MASVALTLPRYDSIEKQKTYVASLLQGLPKNKDHFNRVYKFTFLFAKAADKKVIDLEVAIEFWRVLFGSDLSPTRWQTPESPFLDWWIEFLESKYKKAINKDTWEQTLKFADQCLKDESLKWWSEEAAWPGVVDEFVEYVMAKRPKEETEEMEVEY
jgi:DCN1-like protein 1/2